MNSFVLFSWKSLTKQLLWGYCSCLISSCNKGSMYSFQINVFEAKVFILIHHINFERFLFYRRCPRAILSFSQTFDSLHRHEFHLIIWKPSRMFNTGKIQLSLKKHVDCKFFMLSVRTKSLLRDGQILFAGFFPLKVCLLCGKFVCQNVMYGIYRKSATLTPDQDQPQGLKSCFCIK